MHLDVLSSKVRDFLGELSGVIDRARRHFVGPQNAIGNRDAMIIFTKSWSLVDDTSTVRIRNVGVCHNSECLVLELE